MLLPDLPTLLLVRLGVDALIAAAFWGQMRRYPAIGGPGWWSLAGALSIVASLLLMLRVAGSGPLTAGLSALLFFASNAAAWVGLRAYWRRPAPWEVLGVLLAVQLPVHVGLGLHGDHPAGHQLTYVLGMLVGGDVG